ncbi:MAG: hypothetical protein HUK07_06905, partial [Bacteroidaceae bacterium]|nr:hypothetical protein [Bacteroidaceae bacterium]
KKGAIDNAYHVFGDASSKGDMREGWWCATDFRFRQIMAYKDTPDAAGWGTICVPYTVAVPANTTVYEIVGITADQSRIAIRKVDATEAGTPYIYHTSSPEVIFFESGEKAKSAKTNVNGLRGQFTSATSKYPLDALVLENGKWTKVVERYKVKDFSAYIQKMENLAVLDSWEGESIATEGVVAIKNIASDSNSNSTVAKTLYNVNGTVANKHSKGIKIMSGKKIIR